MRRIRLVYRLIGGFDDCRFASAGDYTSMAVRLFKSIKYVYPYAPMHYDAINCGNNDDLNRMRFLGVEIDEYRGDVCPSCWPCGDDKAALCRLWRTKQILRLISRHGDPVMWLDSDSVVLDSFDDMDRGSRFVRRRRLREKGPGEGGATGQACSVGRDSLHADEEG